MKRVFILSLSFFILLFSVIQVLQAEISIEITKGLDIPRPIGVVPFTWSGPDCMPEDISKIVATDLRNSGKFNSLSTSCLPQQPNNASEIRPKDWTTVGINAVVIGQVRPSVDGSYVVSYQLVDTLDIPGNIMAQNQFKVTRKWLRYAAHATSDEIFERLTGIKGAFRTRIAYVVQTNSGQYHYELRISDYDGYNQMIVHHSTQPLMSPAWSPDGNKIAYVTFESGHSALVIQVLDSGLICHIASFPQHNGAPSFSPDGSKLAFALSKSGSLNLYVMDFTSGHIHQITDDHSNNTEPTWFPDSQTIAYTSDQSSLPQIYKININGGTPQRLSWEGNKNQNAEVSSDGKFLVMVNITNGEQHIAKLNLITGSLQILTNTFLDETPSISPNGTMIIYSSSQGLSSVLQLISINGRFKARLPATDINIKFPAWSPYF